LVASADPAGMPLHAETDTDGRFTIGELLPWMPFWLMPQKGEQFYVEEPASGWRKLSPGQSLDLGNRTVKPYQ
jgi:hypothetical protein